MIFYLYAISLQKELSKDIVFCKEGSNIFVITELQDRLKQTMSENDTFVYFGGHRVLNSLFNVGFPVNNNYVDLQHCFWNLDTSLTNISLETAFTEYINKNKECDNINIQEALYNIQIKSFSFENEKTININNNNIILDLNIVFYALESLFKFITNESVSYADIIDNKLCKTLTILENTNTIIDSEYITKIKNNINERLENIISSLYAITKYSFNINSQRELNFILKNIGVLNNKISNIELTNSYNQTGLLIFKYIDQYRKLKVCYEQYIKPLYNQSIKDGFGRFKYNTCKVPCLTNGHFCFIKDKGIVDISQVIVGDYIWTEYGFKKVVRAKQYKTNELIYVEFSNGVSICGTKHHPVLLNVSKETCKTNYLIKREWCALDHLFVGEKVICNNNYRELRKEMYPFILQKGVLLCDIINKYINTSETTISLRNVRFSNKLTFLEFKSLAELLGIKIFQQIKNNKYQVYDIIFYDCSGLYYLLNNFNDLLTKDVKEKIKEKCLQTKQIQDYDNYCNYDYEETIVTKITPINEYKTVYDIEVEDVHQYNANGIINHNTGRISSTGSYNGNCKSIINIQSVPKNNFEGINVREAFLPNKDCCWCCVDYKAQEVRLASKLYNIKLLKEIPLEDDIYEHIAMIFDVFKHLQIDKKTKRNAIKIITLGAIYGLTNFGIQKQLKQLGIDDNLDFRQEFFNVFPELKIGQENTLKYAHSVNGVYTLSGRFRKINFTKNDKNNFLTRNNRIALNTIIQGTCGDIIRIVLNYIETNITPIYAKNGFSVLNTIHDEINFSIPKDNNLFDNILKDILLIMKTPIKERSDINFGCSISIGDNWGNLTKIPFGG